MNRDRGVFRRLAVSIFAIIAGFFLGSLALRAQTNSWTGAVSGHWEDSTWSLGIPPAADQWVMITNAGSKAVGIFPATRQNFPGTLTVSNLTISAPSNSENTLLLNYAGTAVPLRVLDSCSIGNNGKILNLSSSLSIGQIFSIATNGIFVQQGGVTAATNYWPVEIDGGTAAVTNGEFLFTEMDIDGGGSFTQSGGTVSGNVDIGSDGTYNLIGGFLSGGLAAGVFNQSGGTNIVSFLNLFGTYTLSGGFLSTSNVSIFFGGDFEQRGGVHLAAGTFSCESYTLSGGTLVAPNLRDFGMMAIGPAATISNTASFILQGNSILQLSNCAPKLASLEVSGNGAIDLFGSDKLTFADSSTQAWNGSLTISNWNGLTAGGGVDQVVFGNGEAGLTLRQLERIAFVDPAGFAPGTWLATILPTGEVVPTTSPTGPTQPNLWTSPTSGPWEGLTWSLGVPPAKNQTVLITNAGLKAVAISPSTPVNFPGTMMVGDLFVSAPAGGSNTLLLNFFGTTIPLQVINDCTIGTNASLENLHSGLQIGGDLVVSNASFVQVGGVTWVTNGFFINNANVAMTNAMLGFNNADLSTNATMIQSGGMLNGSNLFVAGTFTQLAGTNRSAISVGGGDGNGIYVLDGGQIESAELGVDGGVFTQNGGTVLGSNVRVGGEGGFDNPRGAYSLGGGVLMCSNVFVSNGDFFQSGGQNVVNGGIDVSGIFSDYGPPPAFGSYTLSGGFLTSSGIGIGPVASFSQTGGTNRILGDLGIGEAAYFMSAGSLSESNLLLERGGGEEFPPTDFIQSGGANQVANEFTCLGRYELDSGTLVAPKIVLQDGFEFGYDNGFLQIGSSPGASVSNPISIELDAGGIQLSNSTQQFGALILNGEATISLEGSCMVRFADSSMAGWTNEFGELFIAGWNGSLSGGGTDQVFFGNSASGLTPQQLQQIRFVNVAGFSSYDVYAKILPTGEVVPTAAPSLTTALQGTNLVVTWPNGSFVLQVATNVTGPFEDISNAPNPFTNDTSQFPARFFRLRQQ